ncbi:cytochrome b5-like heme/steroid binding domain-containing protein [Coemansia spiralis]|nr:cytochrome b5-like heme/steroid binding domain-containing protein [Coemansia spiralis]
MSSNTLKTYTLKDLSEYDGSDSSKPILLGLNYNVYDVTSGSEHYSKGKSYSIFSGRDCTHNFAVSSINESDLPSIESDPIDLQTYSESQKNAALAWERRLSVKYGVVGRLVKAEQKAENTCIDLV